MIIRRKLFSSNETEKKKVSYHLDGKDNNGKRFIVPVFEDGTKGERIYF